MSNRSFGVLEAVEEGRITTPSFNFGVSMGQVICSHAKLLDEAV